jgi:DNA-binding IscR family transcriptional regulator
LNGGFTLARSSSEVTVLEVINAIDPVRRFPECPLGQHDVLLCPLHKKLDDAAQAMENAFGDTTIAKLLEAPRNRKATCKFPAVADAEK